MQLDLLPSFQSGAPARHCAMETHPLPPVQSGAPARHGSILQEMPTCEIIFWAHTGTKHTCCRRSRW